MKKLLFLVLAMSFAITNAHAACDSPFGTGNEIPTADIQANETSSPSQLCFVGSGSNDPEGGALSYNWTLSHDGTPLLLNGSEPSVCVDNPTDGYYVATLTVTDECGSSSNEASLSYTIGSQTGDPNNNQSPVAVAQADVTSGGAPLIVHFDGSQSADPEGGALTYGWLFGDGSPVSMEVSPTHTYSTPGTYSVLLSVVDDWGQGGDDTMQINAGFLGVSPAEHDFGDVELNDTSQMYFTLSTSNPTSTTITDIHLGADSSSAFSITSAPALPLTLTSAATADVAVSFNPTATGPHTGELVIGSDDLYTPTISIPLFGAGVYVEPPTVDVESILDTFDEAIAAGTITGDGPGNSAEGRMGALYNMIEAAGDLIADGDMAGSCRQLMAAYNRCDGASKPPDFITGADAEELAAQIMTRMNSLGCE